jgi:hypothetical protein
MNIYRNLLIAGINELVSAGDITLAAVEPPFHERPARHKHVTLFERPTVILWRDTPP